jgi:putative spermidine/putrescine transport system substrate-binding protein
MVKQIYAPTGVSRIRMIATTLLCSIALLFGVMASEAKAGETVVFAGWGGSIQKTQRDIMFNSFEKETGIKVVDVPDVSLAKIKVMVESGDVQWDVVQTLGMWIPQGDKENLWEKLDYQTIDASGVPAAMKTPTGIGNSAYGMILAYNTEAFPAGKEPQSWTDLWDVTNFQGRRGIHDAPRYTLETALLADGVPMDKIYPLDVDRAFASLERIKDRVSVWWKKWPQVPILLTSREIEMSMISHTRILSIQKAENAPVAIQWNRSLMTVDYLAVPRGAQNKANAMKLINWMTKAELQAKIAHESGIGPSNSKAFDMLSAEDNDRLPSYHYKLGQTLAFDNAWWAENQEAMTERWNSWKLQ